MDINTKLIIPFETIERMRNLAETLYQKNEVNGAYALAAVIVDLVQATGNPAFYAATPFGICPFCGDYEELICVASRNYAICHEHRAYWYIGADYLALRNDADAMLCQNQALLNCYTQISTSEAFPSNACPCCGLAVMHAPWCIMPVNEFDELA